MKEAVDHADSVEDGWSKTAYSELLVFMASRSEFMTEDVRAFAYSRGLSIPPDDRAWGSVITKAAKRKLIVKSGYAPMKSKNCHANPKAVWKVLR